MLSQDYTHTNTHMHLHTQLDISVNWGISLCIKCGIQHSLHVTLQLFSHTIKYFWKTQLIAAN